MKSITGMEGKEKGRKIYENNKKTKNNHNENTMEEAEVITDSNEVGDVFSKQEITKMLPIKSMEEIKKMLPIKSMQEIKSLQEVKEIHPIPEGIARKFIQDQGLLPEGHRQTS